MGTWPCATGPPNAIPRRSVMSASRQHSLVFARGRSLRVTGIVGLVFLLAAYVTPLAVAAQKVTGKKALPAPLLISLQFPSFKPPKAESREKRRKQARAAKARARKATAAARK